MIFLVMTTITNEGAETVLSTHAFEDNALGAECLCSQTVTHALEFV